MTIKTTPMPVGTPPEIVQPWLADCRARIELYWDSFRSKPLPQYVESDFDSVASAIDNCLKYSMVDGNLFCEWGAGFGVITGIAALLGMDAVGIEAESFLCEQAEKLFQKHGIDAEIWQGNFLPRGARDLAIDEDPLVSLTHSIPPAYDSQDVKIDDFAMIFAYPWPGEEHFLRLVFDRFARRGAIMVMHRGPNQIEIIKKT
jgi:hypothetical protein